MTKPEPFDRESSSAHYLGYVVSIVAATGLTFALLRLLLPLLRVLLPVAVGWWLWRRWQKTQTAQQERLNEIFYQLIQEHRGHITVLDFAMTAKVPAIAARDFLDARAKEFSAHFEITERGDIFYLFPTLKAAQVKATSTYDLNGSFDQSDSTGRMVGAQSLTQAQLARRLGVSAGVISRKKLSPTLAEWSKLRDPAGVAWAYQMQTRRFFPAEAGVGLTEQPETRCNG